MKTLHPSTSLPVLPASPAIPSRWARHYRQLQALHEQMLRNCRSHAEAALQPLEPHSMDMADSATDEFDHNLALGLLSHQQDALLEVRAALRRIQEGRYGICEESGLPIAEERLDVLPWTRYTREAAEKLERAGFASRSRLGMVQPLHGFAANGAEVAEEEEEEYQSFEPASSRPKAELSVYDRLAA